VQPLDHANPAQLQQAYGGSAAVPPPMPIDFQAVLACHFAAAETADASWKDFESACASTVNGEQQRGGVPDERAWNELNQLRVHAGAPERSEQGVQKLMQYYAQLCWMEEQFPFGTGKVSFHHMMFYYIDERCSRVHEGPRGVHLGRSILPQENGYVFIDQVWQK
jgi:hypothetical protein